MSRPSRRLLLAGCALAVTAAAAIGVMRGMPRSLEPPIVSAAPAATSIAFASETPGRPSATVPIPSAPPTQHPVEVAVKEGQLKLNGSPRDWERYFIPITPSEATRLLNEANVGVTTSATSTFLFALDPRGSPNLSLKDSAYRLSNGREIKVLGLSGVPVGSTFYSPDEGIGAIGRDASNLFSGVLGGASVNGISAFVNGISIPKESAEVRISNNDRVSIGTPIVTIGSAAPLEFAAKYGLVDIQVFLSTGRGVLQADSGSIRQLLKKDGRIAFIGA